MASTLSRYAVGGMDCGACAAKIDRALRRLPGVEDVSISVATGTLALQHGAETDLQQAEARVVQLGYSIARAGPDRSRTRSQPACCAPAHGSTGHGNSGQESTGQDSTAVAGCCGGEGHDHDFVGHSHNHAHPHDHTHEHGDGHDHPHGYSHRHPDAEPIAAVTSPGAPFGAPALAARPWWRGRKATQTLAAGAALVFGHVLGLIWPASAPWIFPLAVLVGLVPVARRAWAAARLGSPFSIEMLMSIAAIGALLIGAAEEAAMVVFLFLLGELLEGLAARRAQASIQGLAALMPATALLETAAGTQEVAAATLRPGQIIHIRPGARVGADGIILEGESGLNEAPVSGESMPVRKGPGQDVYAGTVNLDGLLRLRVTASAADNTLARVMRLVTEAQESKAPMQRLIDRFAAWYAPAIVLVALAVAVLPPLLGGGAWHEWIYKGLAILLIGCPCALVISTPAAIASALAAGARQGLLVKGGAALERLGQVTVAAFDKTGTLTTGQPMLTDVHPLGTATRAEVLALAAALEHGSSHPLAEAIRTAASAESLVPPPLTSIIAEAGRGMRAQLADGTPLAVLSLAAASQAGALDQAAGATAAGFAAAGKSVSVLLRGDAVLGLLALRDEPRPDAAAGLAALREDGIRPVILTGDHAAVGAAIGAELGVEAMAELLPADKLAAVRRLQAEGAVVAQIGDGINDAPALAAADIGVAMGGGTAVALETADAALLGARIGDLSRLIRLSRAALANIHQNIALALGLKLVFLVTTLLGLTGLWPAILADTGATVLVTANAMRLLLWRGGTRAA